MYPMLLRQELKEKLKGSKTSVEDAWEELVSLEVIQADGKILKIDEVTRTLLLLYTMYLYY